MRSSPVLHGPTFSLPFLDGALVSAAHYLDKPICHAEKIPLPGFRVVHSHASFQPLFIIFPSGLRPPPESPAWCLILSYLVFTSRIVTQICNLQSGQHGVASGVLDFAILSSEFGFADKHLVSCHRVTPGRFHATNTHLLSILPVI